MAKAVVVDDSRAVRIVLAKILRDLGYEVCEAANGREALEMMRTESSAIRLVLADWNMPVMSGLELLHHMRRDPNFSSVPVVMVTSETEPEQIAMALAAGADEYVMKPFTKEVLADKLRLAGCCR
jgi:two-component system chemotaxis response regulator CheY